MRKLPKPVDDRGAVFVAEDVFDTCISNVRNHDLKTRLQAVRGRIAQAAVAYDTAATNATIHQLPRQSNVGHVTKNEMVNVYEGHMVPKGSTGRSVYDKIKGAPKHQRCPLCDLGTVNTLDHHLPKTEYPSLVVTPNNLVPSCQWCQVAKKTKYPNSAGEQTIHPYYDDFEGQIWLKADVVQGTPAAFLYSVFPPSGWGQVVIDRLKHHLDSFRLAELYASNAGGELAGIRARLKKLFASGGAAEVQRHLQEEADTWGHQSNNSWRAALYRAAVASPWFCAGGFAQE